MKYYTSLIIFCLTVSFMFWKAGRAYAQNITPTTPTQFTGVGIHTSCQVSVAGQSNLCLAGDGLWISTGGGPYMQVASGGIIATGVLSVNGKKPDATGNVTISAVSTLVAPATPITGNIALQ